MSFGDCQRERRRENNEHKSRAWKLRYAACVLDWEEVEQKHKKNEKVDRVIESTPHVHSMHMNKINVFHDRIGLFFSLVVSSNPVINRRDRRPYMNQHNPEIIKIQLQNLSNTQLHSKLFSAISGWSLTELSSNCHHVNVSSLCCRVIVHLFAFQGGGRAHNRYILCLTAAASESVT